MVHYSVVQFVDATGYAKEWGEQQTRHRIEEKVICSTCHEVKASAAALVRIS